MAPFNSTGYIMGSRKHLREKEAELRITFNQYGSNVQEFPAHWPFGLQVRAPQSAGGRDSYDLALISTAAPDTTLISTKTMQMVN